jgi:hypothetical protein
MRIEFEDKKSAHNPASVNFINILNILVPKAETYLEKAARRLFVQKSAPKMLMKLTPKGK